jgi:tetratricopeptide (TPR) repeat protein
MKKNGMMALGILITVALAPFTVLPGGGMEDEAFFNDKGLGHYNRAYYEFLAAGKTEQAEEEFEKVALAFQEAIAINDRFVEAHRNLGRVYTVRKKDGAAIDEYWKVVDLEPGNLENYLPLASALERLGRFEEAREVLTRAKALSGDPRVLLSSLTRTRCIHKEDHRTGTCR